MNNEIKKAEDKKWLMIKEVTREVDRGGKFKQELAIVICQARDLPTRFSIKSGTINERQNKETGEWSREFFQFINPWITFSSNGTVEIDDTMLITSELWKEAHVWLKEFASKQGHQNYKVEVLNDSEDEVPYSQDARVVGRAAMKK